MAEQQEAENPWIPSKDFILSDPRSREIREACTLIVRAIHRLLYDPGVAKDRSRQQDLYAGLEKGNGRLIELGIKSEMHVGKREEDFKKSPVLTAEWAAGQLMPATGEHLTSEGEASPILEEFTRPSGLVELGDMPEIAREYIRNATIINMIRDVFHIDLQSKEE